MLIVERQEDLPQPARIGIIGIGGGAARVVDLLADGWDHAPPVALIDSDAGALSASSATTKLQIGRLLTQSTGTGGDAQTGRKAGEEDEELLHGLLDGRDMVILVVCLGGGIGTGVTPLLLKRAREQGVLVICYATLPFRFEGPQRESVAEAGLRELQELADAVVVMPNERLAEKLGETSGLPDAFRESDRLLCGGVRALCLMCSTTGFVTLDYGDLRRLVSHSEGTCSFGYGEGVGDGRVPAALRDIQACPLLVNDSVFAEAESLMVGLVVGPETTLSQVGEFMDAFSKTVNRQAHFAMGLVTDPGWGNRFSVVVFAAEQWRVGGKEPLQEEFRLEGVMAEDAADSSKTRGKRKARQTKLKLDVMGKGRFKNVEPTILHGEDLDIPTFVRRGIVIDK